MSDELSAAFGAILDTLRGGEEKLRAAELPDVELTDGYRWLFSLLAVGLDAYTWADTGRPRFVDIVGPYRKWGGDNADAFYQYAPVDPARTYRVSGTRGDAVYFSLTVYGGPDDGHYSTRIVGTVNDRDVEVAADGTFSFLVGPGDDAALRLEGDAVCAITRDYLDDPATGRRMVWQIEAVDPPSSKADTPAELARRLRATNVWLTEQIAMCPVPLVEPNTVAEPFPVPQVTFGWAAGDAAYARGVFSLADDEVLVVEGRSPECAFWNLCLWNPFLHTFDYAYDRVTINGAQVQPEPDGSWHIEIAAKDTGHPNWLSTQGHERGLLWFRWFYPSATPERPTTRVETR
jgi:hypothetical protein